MEKTTKVITYILLVFSLLTMIFFAIQGVSGPQEIYYTWITRLALYFSLSVFSLLLVLVGYRKMYLITISSIIFLVELGLYFIFQHFAILTVSYVMLLPIIGSLGFLIGNGLSLKYREYIVLGGSILYFTLFIYIIFSYNSGSFIEAFVTALFICLGQLLFGTYSYLKIRG